ncbi:class I adenylate-forming enzyme family protein [Sphingomonas crocodyli]|uniref:Long-chain fatty acid--CoA ligase n=1 Tax=Sphingomonas crocodyli TaxID=1979270 RepID=A0A437M6Q1_9SPHN|nr:AMP-binding protein [Sphingomonas crocodyli]RVT93236.1 long-chain fatty acid--CoA ligase [Sphingomonas crocodyli]
MIHRCIDPVALALTAPDGPFALIDTPHGPRFRDHPHTITGVLQTAQAHGSRRMVEAAGQTHSYDDVFARAGRIAHALREDYHVQPGDYVALLMTAGVDWMASFIAVIATGGAAVLVNTRCVAEEMAHAIAKVGARILIADPERTAIIRAEADAAGWRIVEQADLAAMAAGPDHALAWGLRGEADPAVVLFTSGTTGFPKAVRIDHGAMAHVVALAGMAGEMQDRRFTMESGRAVAPERGSACSATVIASPMFHFSGVMPFLRGAYFGAPLFVLPKWDVETAYDLMEREPLTRLAFVPTMLTDLMASPRAGPDNLGAIMVLSNGAASLDLRTVERLRVAMPDVMVANTYGQTESAAWISTICGADYLAHPDSVGYVLPSVELRIVRDADGQDAAPGEHGEICVRGPHMMNSYVGDPAATAETIRDGWLRTGDNGWVDADGRLYLADRRKNMIISGGENVYCAEVERVLGDHPAVAEVIAYGRPDDRLGERVEATVVLRTAADPEDLRTYARTRLAGYKVPKMIHLRDLPLPRTPTMKIDRGTFRRDLETNS